MGPESKYGKAIVLLIVLLLISNIYLFREYLNASAGVGVVKIDQELYDKTHRTQIFLGLLVSILLSGDSVSEDDQLLLENAARSIENSDGLDAWKSFKASASEDEAQARLVELFKILINEMDISSYVNGQP